MEISSRAMAAIQQKRTLFNKKNGVAFAVVWFIFFTMFMTSVFAILNADRLAPLCAVVGVFGSLCILISSLVLLPSSKTGSRLPASDFQFAPPQPAGLYGTSAQGALPPQQHPADVYHAPQGSWRAPDTGDLIERGSVIENTTKLLSKNKE